MTIVFLVHRYFPNLGGVETYIQQLAGAACRRGHAVRVVAGAHDPSLVGFELVDGIPVSRFPAVRSPLRAGLWFLRRLNLFRSADVVSVSNTHMLELFRCMLGPLVPSRKIVLIRHGMSGRFPVPQHERDRAALAQRSCAAALHDGEFIARWLGVSPDACPPQGLAPEADAIAQTVEPPPTSAVFVGRLEPDTGIRAYVDAVEILNQNLDKPFPLHVYGEGSLGPVLRKQALESDLPVVFHGSDPQARDRIADHCFAFVDGRMAIHEAFARKRVVIAAYGNPWKQDYLCGEAFSPFLLAAANAQEVARYVLDLIQRPDERRVRIERAFEYARALSWDRTVETYLAVWERVASARRAVHRRVGSRTAARTSSAQAPVTIVTP